MNRIAALRHRDEMNGDAGLRNCTDASSGGVVKFRRETQRQGVAELGSAKALCRNVLHRQRLASRGYGEAGTSEAVALQGNATTRAAMAKNREKKQWQAPEWSSGGNEA